MSVKGINGEYICTILYRLDWFWHSTFVHIPIARSNEFNIFKKILYMNWNVTALNNNKNQRSENALTRKILVLCSFPTFSLHSTRSQSRPKFILILKTRKNYFLAATAAGTGNQVLGPIGKSTLFRWLNRFTAAAIDMDIALAALFAKLLDTLKWSSKHHTMPSWRWGWCNCHRLTFFYYLLFTSSFSLLSSASLLLFYFKLRKVRKNNRNFYLKIFNFIC